MKDRKYVFPWVTALGSFRRIFLLMALGCGVLYIIFQKTLIKTDGRISAYFDETLILSFLIFLFLTSIIITYWSIYPILNSLKKNQKSSSDSFFTYSTGAWSEIDETLKEARTSIRDQADTIKSEYYRMKTLLKSLHDPVLSIDLAGNSLFYNKELKALFPSFSSEKGVLTQLSDDLLNLYKSVIEKNKSQQLEDYIFQHDQNRNIYQVQCSPIREESEVTGVLFLFFNISTQKEIERMRESFLANVSHELRSPITSIQGFAQLLQGEMAKEDKDELLERIIINSKKMTHLLDETLKLARIESEIHLEKQKIDVKDLFNRVLNEVKIKYPKKEVEIEFDLKVLKIKGDLGLIHLAIYNIVSNSFKYSSDKLVIKFSSKSSTEGLLLSIKDNGFGFDPEDTQRVLERFYRSQNALDTQKGGSGIGLSIVKHVIKKHGGEVQIETKPSLGCIVTVIMPKKLVVQEKEIS